MLEWDTYSAYPVGKSDLEEQMPYYGALHVMDKEQQAIEPQA